jgi:hypothetical protein
MSSPQAAAATAYIPDFSVKPRHYIVHNSSPDRIEVRWAGLMFVVPPVDGYHPQTPARYSDGVPIPGTTVIADAYTVDPDGTPRTSGAPNWYAAEAVKSMLGISPDGQATSAYAKKGLSILPDSPTREQVAAIRSAGQIRYQEFLRAWAEYTTMAYQEQIARCRQAGVAPKPPGADYHKAIVILRKYDEELKKKYGLEAGAVVEEAVDAENEDFRVFALAQAMKMSEKAAEKAGVDKTKLAESLLEDEEILKGLRRKYRIRKIGYAEGVAPEKPGAAEEQIAYEGEDPVTGG